jgi:hypothetical protein
VLRDFAGVLIAFYIVKPFALFLVFLYKKLIRKPFMGNRGNKEKELRNVLMKKELLGRAGWFRIFVRKE